MPRLFWLNLQQDCPKSLAIAQLFADFEIIITDIIISCLIGNIFSNGKVDMIIIKFFGNHEKLRYNLSIF
jgi:uncharacterized membrane protein